jgi:hypothetical protein
MHAIAEAAILYLLEFLFYVAVPVLAIWGWLRWAGRPRIWNYASSASLIAFVLATASSLLAVYSIAWAHRIGGFGLNDPRLHRMYSGGLLLSATAFPLSLFGLNRSNALRWHALVCVVGTALFWISASIT